MDGVPALHGGVNVHLAEVLAELVPVAVEVPVHGPPNVPMRLGDIPYDLLHLLLFAELASIRKLLVLLQEVVDLVVHSSREVGRCANATGA